MKLRPPEQAIPMVINPEMSHERRSLEAVGKHFSLLRERHRKITSFLSSFAVVVRNCCRSKDEIDSPKRTEPEQVQRNEPELLD